ncbi:MAG: hypothetical protein F6J86_37475 [Symploca sp. SIO1B1]|nr:hypothetical protein [Symploca sp. SIO1B1]
MVVAGFGFVDMSVEEEAKSSYGESIKECRVCDPVFVGTDNRMMPNSNFQAIVVVLVAANLLESIA